ncbi:unnamed protein product [Bursaphelenchus xylophilus]|uniref:Adenylosuccinate lyase n=2 Tax=Bursaphelenchus xylophilus TaxID=6326 RepID=A0A7I8XI20_BURXY|nr:unnamed protein product [Bursaphelenchus xylophilus]CAG9085156.1 unnamed protein product [Bursaphelenchus xylophilus]
MYTGLRLRGLQRAGRDQLIMDCFEDVLSSRYCSKSKLMEFFSEKAKTQTWRQLWIWLAESEKELGLPQITEEMIQEMKDQRDNINWDMVRSEEKRLKHDVMAHNHTFGAVCPKAAGIIHLGATSCYVQDNANLIEQRLAFDYIITKYAIVMSRLADFAEKWKFTVTVGRTHWQTASLVTVGKRAILWLQELKMAFDTIVETRNKARFRGIKGATGTQDSFLTLFKGDHQKVLQLDELVTKKAGFGKKFSISGQTYSRQQDIDLLFCLSKFGAAAEKVAKDIRFLQSHGEIQEPFEENQIGSSAMPYKKNPMKCERVCSLARHLRNMVLDGLSTLADQGIERTLDDSANRRIVIPRAFLLSDAILSILQNVFEGLHVPVESVKRNVEQELPFLALEKALMLLTEHGVSRQEAHEHIRSTALECKQRQAHGPVTLNDTLASDFFSPVREAVLKLGSDPLNFVGRCQEQQEQYLKEEFYPSVNYYLQEIKIEPSHLDV